MSNINQPFRIRQQWGDETKMKFGITEAITWFLHEDGGEKLRARVIFSGAIVVSFEYLIKELKNEILKSCDVNDITYNIIQKVQLEFIQKRANQLKPKVLFLTLKKEAFDVMVTGEKTIEFRKPSKWIKSRLFSKEYDIILFRNGYGNDKPFFTCKYYGYESVKDTEVRKAHYSNGLVVNVKEGDIQIKLGPIIEKGNLKT